MTTSVGSVQGLATGIQWQDMVDQLSRIDQARELDPITAAIAKSQTQSDAWSSYQSVVGKLMTALSTLRDGTAFDAFQVATDTSRTSGRSLLSATAQSGAAPGSYQVEVLDLARAEKLSGAAFPSATAALGLAAGDFVINGARVSVASTDSLNGIRDKINALNTGAKASGVTATVLAGVGGASRLVLSSDTTGASGIQLVDSTSTGGLLQQLGILDGSYAGVTNADGSTTSGRFAATNVPIGTLLGITTPAVTTIAAGNRTISVDLAVDTLDSLAAKITAAGIGARTTTDATGTLPSRLQVDAALSASPSAGNPAVPDPDSLRVLQLLGVMQGGRGAEAQSLRSAALGDASSAPATGATLLSDLSANGGSANIQAGDTIVIAGRRGDGTAVSLSYVPAAGATMDDLLAQLNGPTGFGGGTRAAVASLGADGSIQLTDSTGGSSQLTLSLTVNKSAANGGGSTGIGSFAVETAGRARTITQGSDAQLRVDGVLLTRTSNTVTDAVAGLTFSLEQAEVGTTVGVTATRDPSVALDAVKQFAAAYNGIQAFAKTNTAATGDLANNTALKTSARSFTNMLLTDVLGASITRPVLAGVSLNKTGALTVDDAAFTAAMKTNPEGVRSLFALSGSTTSTDLEYVAATDATTAGAYDVVISSPATRAIATGSAAVWPFVAGGIPMNLSVTDSSTGTTSSIGLSNGDDAGALAAKLNAMFSARGMHLTATVVGGQLSISGSQYGASGFALAYDAGDTTSATQLGLAAGTYNGTDVAGTINGVAAVGSGQTLTGAAGDPSEGLLVRYSGTATGSIGSATLVTGVAAAMSRQATRITRAGDGTAALSISALDRSISAATTRSNDVAARLDRRKQALLKRFAAMEAAIQRITAQGNSLTNSINALTALQSNK